MFSIDLSSMSVENEDFIDVLFFIFSFPGLSHSLSHWNKKVKKLILRVTVMHGQSLK